MTLTWSMVTMQPVLSVILYWRKQLYFFKMRYKYLLEHRLTVSEWAKCQTENVLNNIAYPLLQPIATDIKSCFIVGCGHSGTTLVAEKMGRNEHCFLVNRETGIFIPPAGLRQAKAAVKEWLFFTECNHKSMSQHRFLLSLPVGNSGILRCLLVIIIRQNHFNFDRLRKSSVPATIPLITP